MLMMCWFYCIPFAKGLFYASPILLILFALFALKRGVRRARPWLRQAAFLLFFMAILKMFTIDLYLLREDLLCSGRWPDGACTAKGFKILQASGLLLLALLSAGLFNLYRHFLRNRRQKEIMPEEVHLRFWSNCGMVLVMLLVLWLAAPWVGFLTVGHVPQLFMNVPWQHLAILNTVVLLVGFWKLEDCSWMYDPGGRNKKKYLSRVWTPKDTLWLAVILFLITLAFSYASNDVLTQSYRHENERIRLDTEDLRSLGRWLSQP